MFHRCSLFRRRGFLLGCRDSRDLALAPCLADAGEENSGINVELLENGSVLKYEVSSERNTYLILHANGTLKQMDVDLSGYDVYLDTLQSSNNGVLQPYQTPILKEK